MGADKQPAGGYDSTPLDPSPEPTYTLRITFHKAINLPISDINTRSSDPYILAQINTSQKPRHKEDPKVRYRSRTIQKTVDPSWENSWIVAGIPKSGFTLKIRVYDEDPDDHDDLLGKVRIEQENIGEEWEGVIKQSYKIHKTGANFRAYALRSCASMTHKGKDLHGSLTVSVEVLGKTKEELGKVYTINSFYRIHYSPMIGKVVGTRNKDKGGVERAVFQANELQLQGPVPNELYHRFVEFRGFILGMFESTGLRGRVLHKLLHEQHEKVYIYNKHTEYGEFPDGPGKDMTLQFLDMVHFDQGARIFTYVITLDGLFRFTETGKEIGIDFVSKHTMHSDVNIYIAWSGEFLVRRLAHPDKSAEAPDQETHPADELPNGPPNGEPIRDPKHYELVIDNDSGTYRPQEKLLPVLHDFLSKNFPGLHILTKSCTDKSLAKIKEDQKKTKISEGEGMIYGQASMSDIGGSGSISSDDREDLEERAAAIDGGKNKKTMLEAGVEFLEKPGETIKNAIPGHKGKVEREAAEEKSDQA